MNALRFGVGLLTLLSSVVTACGGSDLTLGGDTDAGASDSGASDSGTDPDAPRPATYPRLLVATKTDGVKIWDNVDTLTAPREPNVVLRTGDTGARGLARAGDRLFVSARRPAAGADRVFVFDGVSGIAAGAAPTFTLAAASFPGTAAEESVAVDAVGGLWTNNFSSGLRWFGPAAKVAAGTTPRATFTHPWGQFGGFVYDATADKVIAGQISGAGLLVWNKASTRTGAVASNDWSLGPERAASQTISGGRYFAVDYETHVFVWNEISKATAPRAPDVTLTHADLKTASSVSVRDDVLVVTNQLPGRIFLYRGASTLTSSSTPTQIIAPPELATASVRGVILARDGRLYVRDDDGITVFADALTAPKLVVRMVTDAVAGIEAMSSNSIMLLE